MKLTEPDPRRVRIQVTDIAPGGKSIPGASLSMVVFDTTAAEVMAAIEQAIRQVAEA